MAAAASPPPGRAGPDPTPDNPVQSHAHPERHPPAASELAEESDEANEAPIAVRYDMKELLRLLGATLVL